MQLPQKHGVPTATKCLSRAIVYQATVTEERTNKKETYVGMTENTFKQRYANHKQSFKQEKHKNQTELSKHIWSLKDQGTKHEISWKILLHAKPYAPGQQRCSLCTAEKFYILCKPEMATLNTRAGMISTCRHRRKHLLTTHDQKQHKDRGAHGQSQQRSQVDHDQSQYQSQDDHSQNQRQGRDVYQAD